MINIIKGLFYKCTVECKYKIKSPIKHGVKFLNKNKSK